MGVEEEGSMGRLKGDERFVIGGFSRQLSSIGTKDFVGKGSPSWTIHSPLTLHHFLNSSLSHRQKSLGFSPPSTFIHLLPRRGLPPQRPACFAPPRMDPHPLVEESQKLPLSNSSHLGPFTHSHALTRSHILNAVPPHGRPPRHWLPLRHALPPLRHGPPSCIPHLSTPREGSSGIPN